jgi:hypothetical protein
MVGTDCTPGILAVWVPQPAALIGLLTLDPFTELLSLARQNMVNRSKVRQFQAPFIASALPGERSSTTFNSGSKEASQTTVFHQMVSTQCPGVQPVALIGLLTLELFSASSPLQRESVLNRFEVRQFQAPIIAVTVDRGESILPFCYSCRSYGDSERCVVLWSSCWCELTAAAITTQCSLLNYHVIVLLFRHQ